jgi:hypothetical protein
MDHRIKTFILCTLLFLTGCASISNTNPPTGNIIGPVIGGGAGAGAAALVGASKPFIAASGLLGAGLGYYLTTMDFSAHGLTAAGGKVYVLGDFVIIDIPTDNIFEVNTADFMPGTGPALDGIANVLARYPQNNIFISGNTSGFWTERFEKNMSECRAGRIAASLWRRGITNSVLVKSNVMSKNDEQERRLIYIGYGDEFPVANHYHIKGMRGNSHIQIISSPRDEALHWDKCVKHFKTFDNTNVGEVPTDTSAKAQDLSQYAYAFKDDSHMP